MKNVREQLKTGTKQQDMENNATQLYGAMKCNNKM